MQKKILVLVSNPKGTTNLELLPEINQLKEALRRSVNRERFVVEWEVAVRQTDLRRHILDIKPQIIHFCGHGTEQGLVLGDDETGKAKIVSNEVLTDLLRAFADLVECVVLNACDSEPLADDLVQHLNYVIGMNQEVRDDAAIAFAEGFYDTLGAGESYERAFEIGKNAVLGKATLRHAPDAPSRKAEVLGQDGKPVKVQNREHLIPVLKINPNPTPIKPLWLAPEVERQVVRDLLKAIESGFNTIKLFHTDEPIVLKDQYIPVQVTLERRYKHSVETIGGYAESEAELRRLYAMKGSGEADIQEEIKRQQVDWEEARRQHLRIVVLADPGMGKSTLLRTEVVTSVQEAYKALEEGKPVNDITIPLFIRLSSLADEVEKMPAGEAILKIIQERHFTLLKEHENAEVVMFLNAFLKKQLLNGKALLLLDALDEVPDGKCQKLLEKLNEFAKGNQTNPCPIVGTSRIVGYGGRFVDGAKDVEIVPFTQKQTEEYIEKWFEYAPLRNESVSARSLIQALRERPQLAGLTQNPLLLSLICSLYQQDYLTLPVRRCQLYEQAVNYMLGQWSTDNERQSANEGWILAKKELLEELAYQFSCESKQLFSFGELRKKLEKHLKSGNASTDLEGVKAADLIKELCEQDGILQRWTAEDDRLPIERRRYLFLHRTFQEYLTASYLSRVDEDEIEFEKLFWNYDWHETISLMAGLMYEPIDLIQRIIDTKDDIFQTQLLLSGRCIAECGELSDPLVDEIIDRIYQFWLTYPAAEFIRSVVVAIGRISSYMLNKLQTSIYDNNWIIREYTAMLLGEIRLEVCVNSLIYLLSDDSYSIKEQAVLSLGAIGNEQAIEPLLHLLQIISRENNQLKKPIAQALGMIGDRRAIEALLQLIRDEDELVQNEAASALGRIATRQTVDVLDVLSREDRLITSKAKTAFVANLKNSKGVNILINALHHEESNVRQQAAEILGEVGEGTGNHQITKELVSLATNDPEGSVRRESVRALGWINDKQNIERLIPILNRDKDSSVRLQAAWVLGRLQSEQATAALISALRCEPDVWVKSACAGALANHCIGKQNKFAIDALIQVLKSKNHSDLSDNPASSCIVEALGLIGNEQEIEILIEFLFRCCNKETFFSYSVIKSSAKALGWLGKRFDSERAVEALIAVLGYENLSANAIQEIIKALGYIGGNTATKALISIFSNSQKTVRDGIIKALGEISSSEVIEFLIKLLSEQDIHIMSAAAKALSKSTNNLAIEALGTILKDSDRARRWEATVSLSYMKPNAEVGKVLLIALQDDDPYIRQWAANSLARIDDVQVSETLTLAICDGRISANDVEAPLADFIKKQPDSIFIEKLQNDDLSIRRWAILFLKEKKSKQVVDALIQVLDYEEKSYKYKVAVNLAQLLGIKFHQVPEKLISEALRKNYGDFAWKLWLQVELPKITAAMDESTIRCIITRWENQSISDIASKLHNISQSAEQEALFRESLVKLLGELKVEEAVEVLALALTDESWLVRYSAIDALEKIGNGKGADALLESIYDQNPNVRNRAVNALEKIDRAVNALKKNDGIPCLKKFLRVADSDLIYSPDVFPLIRRWVVGFSKAGLPFIPVYPEVIPPSTKTDRAEE